MFNLSYNLFQKHSNKLLRVWYIAIGDYNAEARVKCLQAFFSFLGLLPFFVKLSVVVFGCFSSEKDLWREGRLSSVFFKPCLLVCCVFDVRWAPLGQEAEWSWLQRMTTASSVMPPSAPRLWPRLTIKGRIMPRGCGWLKLRVTRSRRYCHFLWGQGVMWDRLSLKRAERDPCLEVLLF